MIGRLQVITNEGKLRTIITYVAAISNIVNKCVHKIFVWGGRKAHRSMQECLGSSVVCLNVLLLNK